MNARMTRTSRGKRIAVTCLALFVSTTGTGCPAPGRSRAPELTIAPGNADPDSPDANIVVSLDGHTCTGTLITPLAVLTANHCLTGARGVAHAVSRTPTVYV